MDQRVKCGKVVEKKEQKTNTKLHASHLNHRMSRRWPYLSKFSSTISEVVRPYGLQANSYNLTAVSELFRKQKELIPPWKRSSVYCSHCSSCPAVYMAETGRQFSVRVREHADEANSTGPHWTSAFAEHIETKTTPFTLITLPCRISRIRGGTSWLPRSSKSPNDSFDNSSGSHVVSS